MLELKVAKSDMGRIIGKHGRTANAIRVVLYAASGKTRRRYVLDLVEVVDLICERADLT